jgi:hypothetical protein
MECGPRALGNRSILANPMSPDTKDRLNAGIKKRESFRPYAPSVLQEECRQWFDLDESPYMLLEATVHHHQREKIPAVVHVDGSSRPQTVTPQQNPRYHRLLRRFHELTGVPMVLNTSFNQHGEPMVNRPEEAIAVLLGTEMDDLFIADYHVRRNPAVARFLEWVSTRGAGVWKGQELPHLFDLHDIVPHNRARITQGREVTIATDPNQWSYAAALKLNPQGLPPGGNLAAILVQVRMRVDAGRIGVMFVADDLQSVIGKPVEQAQTDQPSWINLLLEPVPASGWLIVRNNAEGKQESRCIVSSLQAFRASYRPLGAL